MILPNDLLAIPSLGLTPSFRTYEVCSGLTLSGEGDDGDVAGVGRPDPSR